jgi:hypothetical protein
MADEPMNDTQSNSALQSVCVYCGSGPGKNPAYVETARAVLNHGGHVTGIIPGFLSEREHMLIQAQELIVVDDMHQRKQLMFVKSDAFVALPGGLGTLEEFVEQLTWSQLGRHAKPIVLANIEGFWNPLLVLFDRMGGEGFIRPGLELNVTVVDRVEKIIPAIEKALGPFSATSDVQAEAELSAKF